MTIYIHWSFHFSSPPASNLHYHLSPSLCFHLLFSHFSLHLHTQLQFVSPSAEEFDILQRQMKARIEEGQGETIYEIGVGGRNFSFFSFVHYSLCQGTTKGTTTFSVGL